TLLIVPTILAQSQITTGQITGVIRDANGDVVPGVTVEIKNRETGLLKTATTNEDGRYTILALPPGNYSVQASKQGFTTPIIQSTPLTVGQSLTADFALAVSDVQEKVTVESVPTVDLVKTEVSTTINATAVSTTPILGRKFEDLLTLTPGVSITQGPDGDEINFSGQRGIFNNVSLDGGDYNNGFFGEQLGGQR